MEEFIEQNKAALIEEMAESISSLSSIIESILSSEEEEGKEENLKKAFVALSYKTGYLSAVFNQYFIFLKKEIPEKGVKSIGFSSIMNQA